MATVIPLRLWNSWQAWTSTEAGRAAEAAEAISATLPQDCPPVVHDSAGSMLSGLRRRSPTPSLPAGRSPWSVPARVGPARLRPRGLRPDRDCSELLAKLSARGFPSFPCRASEEVGAGPPGPCRAAHCSCPGSRRATEVRRFDPFQRASLPGATGPTATPTSSWMLTGSRLPGGSFGATAVCGCRLRPSGPVANQAASRLALRRALGGGSAADRCPVRTLLPARCAESRRLRSDLSWSGGVSS